MTSVAPVATHRVETFQEGDWWEVRVVGLDANYTQARTFDEVGEMARDLIALVLNVDQTEVGLIEVIENRWR